MQQRMTEILHFNEYNPMNVKVKGFLIYSCLRIQYCSRNPSKIFCSIGNPAMDKEIYKH